MTAVQKIDSNATGLRYAEEASIGVLPVTPDWVPLEPNDYSDFGGAYKLVARNPINAGRQRKKGVIVDLDAAGGFKSDLLQNGLQDLLQGYFFANFRRKGEEAVTSVVLDTTNPDEYLVASTTGFLVGSLVLGKNFANAANNTVNEVTVVTTDTAVKVADGTLVAEASPPATAKIINVGFMSATGDIDVTNAGAPALPRITSTVIDFTTLGYIPGEWIYMDDFGTAGNNCWARIYSVAAHVIVFDKTSKLMVTEANTTHRVKLYHGRVLKNESDQTLQVRHTYQLERTLGASDSASPSQIQSEYIVGAVPDEFKIMMKTADKAEVDLKFMATDHEQRTGATGVKSGNRPASVSEDAYNTSNDFAVFKLHVLDRTAGAFPNDLFAYLSDLEVDIKNNVSANKAISRLGSFDMTAGQFIVEGKATAYFSNVTAVAAVRNNSDVTMHAILTKDNAGFVLDIPLIALGDGRLKIAQDAPVMLDLAMPAAADEVFDHTLLMVFFDYIPTTAG